MKNHFKKIAAINLILLMCITTLTGCSKDPKNFSCGALTVTLNKTFKESSHKGFDLYVSSENVIFSVVEETEENLEFSGYTISNLKGYCEEIMLLNEVSSDALKQRNDYYYFTNKKTFSGASYTYVHCMFYGAGSYWICEFVCKSKNYDAYKDRIFKWADSITIQ